ncbi:unnamed protein product [Pleuronectes platessa]|uniref:C2H2-type domain-containing protein n=1 Tax=Pleuronectes platessa TaxID=8262 RepID=A0A9N7YBM7_PLEPL|nr:unnamed protein product [Pleuronectes platessa]
MFQPASRPSFGGRELRRSVREGNGVHFSAQQPRTQVRNKITVEEVRSLRYNGSRPATKPKLQRGSTKEVVKTKCKPREEGRKAGSQGLTGDLGKRQSKPPIKLLDSGFLFSFCRSTGGPIAGLKKEEESVDICLTRSVSQVKDTFGAQEPSHRTLRARGPPSLPVVKKEREERTVSQSRVQRPRRTSRSNPLPLAKPAGSKVTRAMSKQQGKELAVSSKNCVLLDAVRRARLKQLRGPRSQAPKVLKAAHTCPQCPASYKDCDALIMHRLRHIEGKHWPCPLCRAASSLAPEAVGGSAQAAKTEDEGCQRLPPENPSETRGT